MRGIYAYFDKKDNSVVYVGKDSSLDKQRRRYDHQAPCNYEVQPFNRILQNNPNRYTYQVLTWNVTDQETLNALEIQYIRQYNPKFNFTDGGDGMLGFKHSEESKRKMSEFHKGKVLSEETRKRFSEVKLGERNNMYGKKHSKNTKKLMSLAATRLKNKTGYYRVSKKRDLSSNQGFTWVYQYYDGEKRRCISSVNFDKLEEKVKAKGLEWYKLEEVEE